MLARSPTVLALLACSLLGCRLDWDKPEMPDDGMGLPDAGSGQADSGVSGHDAGSCDAHCEPEPDTLHVVQSTPADDSVEVPQDAVVEIVFSADLDRLTVTAQSFKVLLDGQRVPGTFGGEGRSVRFTPLTPWRLGSLYTVELTEAILDLDARQLVPTSISFRARDGVWTTSMLGSATRLGNIALSPSGEHGAVAFTSPPTSDSGGLTSNRVHRQMADRSWGESALAGLDPVNVPDVDIADDGSAAVTYRSASQPTVMRVNAAPTLTDPFSGTVAFGNAGCGDEDLHIAQSGAETVFCAEDEDHPEAGNYVWSLWSALTGAGSSRGALTTTTTISDIASARLGDSMQIVWVEGDRVRVTQSNHYNQVAATLSQATATASKVALASDALQRVAVAVFLQEEGGIQSVWASRMPEGGAWSTAEPISSSSASASAPSVSVDPLGRAIAAWVQGGSVVVAYLESGVWSAPAPLSGSGGAQPGVEVLLEEHGNALAFWPQKVGSRTEVWASRFHSGAEWSPPARISPEGASLGAGPSYRLSADVDDLGRAALAFVADSSLWVVRFE